MLKIIEPSARRRGTEGVAGVYGLVDLADPLRVRYVGASMDVARRVWEHVAMPHGARLAAWKQSGARVAAVLLERGRERERYWIDLMRAFGMADLNTTTPR